MFDSNENCEAARFLTSSRKNSGEKIVYARKDRENAR